jgi:hypothetical protein
MKAIRIVLLCSAVALPQLAMAALPSPQALGTVNAILTFCEAVDPRDVATFQQEWASVQVGSTAKQVSDAQGGSGGYKQAFDLVTAELHQTSRADVASACAVGAQQWRGPTKSQGKGDDKSRKPTGPEKNRR